VLVARRQVIVEAVNESRLTANQASTLEERRLGIWNKLKVFRDLQRLYMPGAVRVLAVEDEAQRRIDTISPTAELIKLYLPSDLPAATRAMGCTADLPGMEAKLREAQCRESLNAIRDRLHSKKHLLNHKTKNATGQYKNTCARTLID
jgi:hypothetical protein